MSVASISTRRVVGRADAASAAARAGAHLDLVRAPFTLPRSRILILRDGDRLRVHTSEYERSLEECVALDALEVCDAAGTPMPITRVLPHVIEFGGDVTLTFAGTTAWCCPSRGCCRSAWSSAMAPSRSRSPARVP